MHITTFFSPGFIFSFSVFGPVHDPDLLSGPAGTLLLLLGLLFFFPFRHHHPIVISLCILICTAVHPIPLLHRSFPATHCLTNFFSQPPFFDQFVDARHRHVTYGGDEVVCTLRASRPPPQSTFRWLYCIRSLGRQHIKLRPIVTHLQHLDPFGQGKVGSRSWVSL